MKILFTVEFYHPCVGGAERVVRELAQGLARRGHLVTVATSKVPDRESLQDGPVHIAEFDIQGNAVKGMQGELERYRGLLLSGSFDVLVNYAAQAWPTDLALPLLRSLSCRKVLIPCGYSGLSGWRRIFYWHYFHTVPRSLRLYDSIVYATEASRDKVFGDRHVPEKAAFLPNGVSLEEFSHSEISFRQTYGIQTPYLLLSVGNHYWVKGHDFLLKAFALLRREDVTLLLVGNPPRQGRGCYACCKAKSLGKRMVLASGVPRSHVVAAYRDADVILLGSEFEYAPLTLLEAMAAHRPFVSRDVGTAGQLPGGWVVRTPTEMSRAIASLLADPALRAHLGESGYRACGEHFSWDRIVKRYEALFASLLEERKAA